MMHRCGVAREPCWPVGPSDLADLGVFCAEQLEERTVRPELRNLGNKGRVLSEFHRTGCVQSVIVVRAGASTAHVLVILHDEVDANRFEGRVDQVSKLVDLERMDRERLEMAAHIV